MTNSKYRYRCIIDAAAVCMIFVGASTAAIAEKIVLGYAGAATYGNAYVAAKEGIFARHGLDVEMMMVPNSGTLPAALQAGSLHIATPTAPNTMQAVEQGLDLVIIAGAAYYTQGQQDVAVLVRPDGPINTARDFEGKRVSTPGLNGFLHVLFRKWMTDNGGDYNKVSFTENAFAQSIDVLRSGQVDAFLAPQPFLTRAVETDVGRVVGYFISEIEGDVQSGWYVATRAWAEANPDKVKAFQAAIQEATDIAARDPSIVRAANLDFIPFPPEVQATFADPRFKAVITPDIVEKWNDIMSEQGMLERRVDPAQLIYN